MKNFGLLLVAIVASAGVYAADTINALPLEKEVPEIISSLGQIEQIARNTQKQFWQLIPPVDDPLYIHPDQIVRAVDWDSKEWPKSILKQMVAEMGTAGLSCSMYPFYRITVVETRAGELVYYNSYDQEVWRTPAPLDYNPYLFAFQHFGVETEKDLSTQQKIYGRSSNVGSEILLLPEVFMDSYEADVALEAQAMKLAEPMAMMSAPPASTNLMLAIGVENNEVEGGVYFPANYTNAVTIFQCTSLTDWDWSIFTNISSVGISEFTWIDESATNAPTHYWVAAERADDDLDGLENGVEKYVHSTDPGNADTDGDGISDGDEVAGGTNPLYADSDGDGMGDAAEVALTNSIAVNGSGGVLVVVPQTGWYHAVDPNLNLVYLGE